MDIETSAPPELTIEVVTANRAKASMPQSQPVDRKLFRKVMGYSFEVIKQRSSAGFSHVNLSLTKMPELEARRIKILKRLGFDVREQEFELAVIWNKE
jgi:hypothetical protein